MAVTYAGIDWLTMTTNEDRIGIRWYQIYLKYRAKMQMETDKEEPFNNGYYAGLGIAGMRWGYNEKIGYIFIISGSDAELMWDRLQPVDWRVTRLDICVDYILKRPSYEARKAYRNLKARGDNDKRRYSLFENNAGGATCYIGSRQSQQFGRLYDKGIQAKTHDKGIKWRAEVEYKKPLAGIVAAALAQETPEDRELVITSTVAKWFQERGAYLSALDYEREGIKVSVEQRITTADKKLAWLRSQVAPSVRTLIEAGYGKEVLQCLLLDGDRLEDRDERDLGKDG